MEGTEHNSSLHTEGTVADYFQLESLILSSLSADAYKAVDVTRNQGVCLWIGRNPLPLNSDEVTLFLDRMQVIDSFEPPVCDLVAYAVDSIGVPFAVFPPLDGFSLGMGNIDSSEAERRFVSCLRLVERLHKVGLPLRDIGQSTFWVTRSGSVMLVGVMGSLAFAESAMAAPPPDALHFQAPEQRVGERGALTSDVYALGVLGFYLFTRQYPYNPDVPPADLKITDVPLITDFCDQPSPWVQEVLVKCLHPDPQERYQSALEILQGIKEVRVRESERPAVPVRTPEAKPGDLVAVTTKKQAGPAPSPAREKGERQGRLLIVILAVVSMCVGASVALYFKFRAAPAAPPVIPETLPVAMDPVEGIPETAAKSNEFEKLSQSDDPLAHELLISHAKEATDPRVRALAENAVLERARRLGLVRAAEQIRGWLRSVTGATVPEAYEPLLRVLSATLPSDERDKALRRAYASQPSVTLRVGAALALDLGALEDFQPILSQLVGDALTLEDAVRHSTSALILRHPDLSQLFGADVIQGKDKLTDDDVVWLLGALAERGDFHVKAIADLALERRALPPIREIFLSLIRDKGDVPQAVLRTLTRGAAGVVEERDLTSLGQWFDLDSEKVLYAMLVSVQDPVLAESAVDILAGKSLLSPIGTELMRYIRTTYWPRRRELALLIGVAGAGDLASSDDLERAMGALSRFAEDKKLLGILVSQGTTQLAEVVTEKFSNKLGVGRLLKLLEHPSPKVRKQSILELAKVNNIGAIQVILDAYRVEKDPELRKLYEDTFWFVKRQMS